MLLIGASYVSGNGTASVAPKSIDVFCRRRLLSVIFVLLFVEIVSSKAIFSHLLIFRLLQHFVLIYNYKLYLELQMSQKSIFGANPIFCLFHNFNKISLALYRGCHMLALCRS